MKRVALIAGVSIAAFWSFPTDVRAWTGDFNSWPGGYRGGSPYGSPSPQAVRPRARKSERRDPKNDKTPAVPAGPLHIIVSIDKQRATLFADGAPVASTAISSGTPGHPTPMGVFTVIQKDRHHISNLYDAPMPYMQRITWSGSALHEGPLPGYPASHGCVRLTSSFAQLLWKATKMGARVIVTHPDVAPIAFEHPHLFVPKPKMVEAPAQVTPAPAPTAAATVDPASAKIVRTADAADTIAATGANGAKPLPALAAPAPIVVDERPKDMPAPVAREANGRPISVFVSLKERKLYVRQGWKPLFDAPVTFEQPEQPIGTHVYTAMGYKTSGDDLRWTVVSIPSDSGRHKTEFKGSSNSRKAHHTPVKPSVANVPMPSPAMALDRIVMPPDVAERISGMITPGSSLIVSDNRLSDETGEDTDFIVLTR
jgi:hypothetical protein